MIREMIADVLVDKIVDSLNEGIIFGPENSLNRKATKTMMIAYKDCRVKNKDMQDTRKRELKCQASGLKKARAIYKAGIGACKDDKCTAKVKRWISDCDQEIGRMEALLKVK